MWFNPNTSSTLVVSPNVSTNNIVLFENGAILDKTASIGDIDICDEMVKKNLDPFNTSDLTHILPCMRLTSRFEIDSPSPVPPYS